MGEPPHDVVWGGILSHKLDKIETGTSYNERLRILLRELNVTVEIPPMTEEEAERNYLRIRKQTLGPYQDWMRMYDKIVDARIEVQG